MLDDARETSDADAYGLLATRFGDVGRSFAGISRLSPTVFERVEKRLAAGVFGASSAAGAPAAAPLAGPQTSTGSRIARSMSSSPFRWNLPIFASVPASTIVFVMTLWAWRL